MHADSFTRTTVAPADRPDSDRWSECYRCGADLKLGRTFMFRGPLSQVAKCLKCALIHPRMVVRSFLTALVVGTILTLLNQGDDIFTGNWSSSFYWKIPLTYCTPYCVATWGALTNARR